MGEVPAYCNAHPNSTVRRWLEFKLISNVIKGDVFIVIDELIYKLTNQKR